MSRLTIQMLSGFLVAIIVTMMYLYLPANIQSLDNRIRDYMFILRGPIDTTGNVVIVDIDEKSLKAMGQWPWQRNKFAQVLQNLTNAGAAIIGLDIVFAEEDNSNPAKVLKELGYSTKGVEDYDQILADTLSQTPTVVGYVFKLQDDGVEAKEPPDPSGNYGEKPLMEQEYLIQPYGAILNTPRLQKSAQATGFFNTIPDPDGIIRSVPLAMKYDFIVYPSLGLDMVRNYYYANAVTVLYSEEYGVEAFRLDRPVVANGEYVVDDRGRIKMEQEFFPTDRHGRLFVNFRGPSKTFPYLSAVDIYNNTFDIEAVKDKIVLIGTSAAGLLDLRAMPYDSVYPGVEVHANMIDNMLAKDFISKPSWTMLVDIAMIFVVGFALSALLGVSSALISLGVVAVFFTGLFGFNYYMLFEQGIILNIFFVIIIMVLLLYMISIVLNYFLETKQKNMIKGKFASKVSPAVMDDILKNADSNVLAAHEREITVSFSDVRNFTNISEAMGNPKSLIEFMNEYMDPMTEIIIKSGGTVDKFIGDAIMSYWNAPQSLPNHAEKAVDATLDQLHALKPLNEKLRNDPRFINVVKMADANHKPIVDIGIGLNTGVAIAGEMGSSSRSDYTVIGDPINLGSRLESLCKFYNSKCNVSNFTKAQLPENKYIFRFLDLVTVKGKKEPVEIWQIHDYENPPTGETLYAVSRERLQEELDRYHEALALYKAAKFADALAIFKEMESWEDKTNLAIYQIYIERCEHYIEEPPVDFNGVFVHKTKG